MPQAARIFSISDFQPFSFLVFQLFPAARRSRLHGF
jgi:hypothetical protein